MSGLITPGSAFVYPDEARRMSDAHNLHLSVHGTAAAGKWIACNLGDGRSDGVLYDTREQAIRHQFSEWLCAYVCIQATGMTPRQAWKYLEFTRGLYKAGMRIHQNNDPGHAMLPLMSQ